MDQVETLPCHKCLMVPVCKNKKDLINRCSLIRSYLQIYSNNINISSLQTEILHDRSLIINKFFNDTMIYTSNSFILKSTKTKIRFNKNNDEDSNEVKYIYGKEQSM